MTINLRNAAILGAGLGSRLKSLTHSKPLLELQGMSLLSRTMNNLKEQNFSKIHCALREELLSAEDKNKLPQSPSIHYLFKNTESSLHTLGELIHSMEPNDKTLPEHLFITMADTILHQKDLTAFVAFCRNLEPEENAILTTPYIRDEKPLVVKLDSQNIVSSFGEAAKENSLVTSGIYCFSPLALSLVNPSINQGMHKMRNFLAHLVEKNQKIRGFVVEKTIDIDHPEDIDDALRFLGKA